MIKLIKEVFYFSVLPKRESIDPDFQDNSEKLFSEKTLALASVTSCIASLIVGFVFGILVSKMACGTRAGKCQSQTGNNEELNNNSNNNSQHINAYSVMQKRYYILHSIKRAPLIIAAYDQPSVVA